ncbi:MAG: anaerobic sulfatase maturase [Solirubrobacterales bacterium]
MIPPSAAPQAPHHGFHVLAKPAGAICNLDCSYCFYLTKEELYPGSKFRMSEEVLRAYLGQAIASEPGPTVTVAWQGGEPTLLGVDFYRRAAEIVADLLPAGKTVEWTMQTNGTRLDEEWCELFAEHGYLVGLSLDGPRPLHDAYRLDKRGRGTFDRVVEAARLLDRRGVDFNLLCCVSAANADRGLEVYRFFRDGIGARYMQFIPVVERIDEHGATGHRQSGDRVTDRTVSGEQWGGFLIEVFDEWVSRDVGEVFVVSFDWALAAWLGMESPVCLFRERCGAALALEHNGDLYSCDHFVEPGHLLGNILSAPLSELAASDRQRRFGEQKEAGLPGYCRRCEVRFACNGECPKNRFLSTPDGEPGLNYLCAGYRAFFNHVDRPMRVMADLLRSGRPAVEAMGILAEPGTRTAR